MYTLIELCYKKTRTKTSIRYAKENDREKRERRRERIERDRESERESKILVKSPKPRNKAQRMVDYKNYDLITKRRNYDTKLSASIL